MQLRSSENNPAQILNAEAKVDLEFHVKKIIIDHENIENAKYCCYMCRQFAF